MPKNIAERVPHTKTMHQDLQAEEVVIQSSSEAVSSAATSLTMRFTFMPCVLPWAAQLLHVPLVLRPAGKGPDACSDRGT